MPAAKAASLGFDYLRTGTAPTPELTAFAVDVDARLIPVLVTSRLATLSTLA